MIKSASEIPLRLILTGQCPAHCEFCHSEGSEGTNRILSMAEIDATAEMSALLSIRRIQLTGGEPLVRTDIREVIAHIISRNPTVRVSLTTNGFFLNPEVVRVLLDAGVKKLSVSLSPWLFEMCRIQDPAGIGEAVEKLIQIVLPFANMSALEFNFCIMQKWLRYLPDLLFECNRFSVPVDLMAVGWHPGLSDKWYQFASVEPSFIVKACLPLVKDIALRFESTPYLELMSEGKVIGKLKHPSISRQFRLKKCTECPFLSKCPETSCVIRIYPGWKIGTCLLDLKLAGNCSDGNETDFRDNLSGCYQELSTAIDRLAFLQFSTAECHI